MTFKVFSLGCKVNSYECASLAALFKNEGYIESEDNPDIVVINTCSVTATADQKSRQHIRKFKTLYPNAIIVVMGCYSQGNSEFIKDEIKADIIVGTSNRDKIPTLIKDFINNKKQIVLVDNNPREFTYEEMGVTSYTENVRAYLKIQDGCDNFCTYCLIPYRRGKMRSRNKEMIIEEAKYLVSQGYQEIILAGIHVGGYGKDFGNISFSDLVEELLNIEGLKNLRISSIEESEIDEKLINLYKTRNNLAHHLHIPLQSGSDTVLKRMNRKYSTEQFLSKMNIIHTLVPDVMLSTDVIVGFPGESEKEFQETCDFIKKCGFNQLHVFPFSARSGTAAFKMPNQIDPQIKKDRTHTLIDLSKKLWEQYIERFIGRDVIVLVEKYENGFNIGHTSNYLEVAISSNEEKVSEYLTIKLNKSMIQSN